MAPRTATKEPGTAVSTMTRQTSYLTFMENFDSMVNLCTMLAKSGKLGNIRSPESAIAVALQASELGIPPMTGFNNLYQTPAGKIGMSASLMQAMVLRDIPGVKFTFDEKPDSCTVTIVRPGWEPYVSCYRLEDAKKAGLIKSGSNWEKIPSNMMRARALANGCRVIAPEVLAGMYAPEELDESAVITITAATTTVDPVTALGQLPRLEEPGDSQESGVIDVDAVESSSEQQETVASPVTSAVINASTNGSTNGTHDEPPAAPANAGPKAPTSQLLELKRLREALNLKDSRWQDTLANYKVTTARDLSGDQAMHLIGILRKREEVAAGN